LAIEGKFPEEENLTSTCQHTLQATWFQSEAWGSNKSAETTTKGKISVMERFCVGQLTLPEHLHRVQYPGTQTIKENETGFSAQETMSFYINDKEFCTSIV
jgi:hypothetical protein